MGGSELRARSEGAEGLGVYGGVEVVVVLPEDVPVVMSGCKRPGELEFGLVRRRGRVSQEGVQGIGQFRLWHDREGGRVQER